MFKFLHAADIHLDSPLRNLDCYDGAPVEVFRNATRQAFDRLIDLAIEEQVRFVLIAGDLYDGDCRDSKTPLHFRRQTAKLGAQGIQVFVIQGNHDAGLGRQEFRFQLPANVTLFSTQAAETHRIEELGVAIHGQGFAERSITENLAANYPEPIAGFLNIGLLHTSCGVQPAHDTYAPSTVRGLTNKAYQYWALGHVHKREQLAGPRPWIVYPGNLQGRHIGEAGPKGCELVTVEHGEISQVEPRHVDVVRWAHCQVDVTEAHDGHDVIELTLAQLQKLVAAADDRPLAVRVQLAGTSPAHLQLTRHPDHWERTLREHIVDRFDEMAWLEKVKCRTSPVSAPELDETRQDAVAHLISALHDDQVFASALDEIRGELDELFQRYVPTDTRCSEEQLDLDDPRLVQDTYEQVRDTLLGRLLGSGVGESGVGESGVGESEVKS